MSFSVVWDILLANAKLLSELELEPITAALNIGNVSSAEGFRQATAGADFQRLSSLAAEDLVRIAAAAIFSNAQCVANGIDFDTQPAFRVPSCPPGRKRRRAPDASGDTAAQTDTACAHSQSALASEVPDDEDGGGDVAQEDSGKGDDDNGGADDQEGGDSDTVGDTERRRCRWRPDQIELLLQHIHSRKEGQAIGVKQAAGLLGLSCGYQGRTYTRVYQKLQQLRCMVQRGEDPRDSMEAICAGQAATRAPFGTYQWRVWIREALKRLPGKRGTAAEVGALIEADPLVSPKLDRRPDCNRQNLPRWHRALRTNLSMWPEFVPTNDTQRNDCMVYRLEERRGGPRQRRTSGKGKRGRQPHKTDLALRGDAERGGVAGWGHVGGQFGSLLATH